MLIGIIGAAAVIIAAIITASVRRMPTVSNSNSTNTNQNQETTIHINSQPVTKDLSIVVLDKDTGVPVPGAIISVTGSTGKIILQNQRIPELYKLRGLEDGDYTITASADTYEAAEQVVNLYGDSWQIRLKKTPLPLPFIGVPWGKGLSANSLFNTVTLSGTVNDAGYVGTGLNALGGKKLILEIEGTANSSFYNNQLLKLEVEDKKPLRPENVLQIIEDGYIPVFDGRVIFAIPDSFKGRLNMVFYHATLRDLRITAFYEQEA